MVSAVYLTACRVASLRLGSNRLFSSVRPDQRGETNGPTEDRRAVDRDGRIRTGDPLNPIQVRYRTAPRPGQGGSLR